MICDTYADTDYIDLANNNDGDPDIDATDIFLLLSSDNDNITKAMVQQSSQNLITSDTHDMKIIQFKKLQEEELLTTLHMYQSYIVGLVIVSSYMSAQLSKSITLLHTLHSPSNPAFLQPKLTPHTVNVTTEAPKSTCGKVWSKLKPFTLISEGKKVHKFDEVKASVAVEATEYRTLLD